MSEENIGQEFRLKYINETRNYFLEKIKQNELIIKKHKTVCTSLNFMERFLILASTIIGCIFNFCFYIFDWCSYRNYKFCNRIKNLCNNCRN